MKLLLDTANVADIRYFNENYPLVGVTTNPTILSREGGDIVAKLLEIRSIIGNDKQLHVQVTESTFEGMVAEAHAIVELLGENTFVKVPVSDLGLKVTKKLAEDGIGVTETAILTATQAMLAAEAGASYVAPYVSRLENIMADGIGTVADIADIFANAGYSTEILAASFKTAKQVLDTALAGAETATVAPDVMKLLASHPTSTSSIEGFERDWNKAFGDNTLLSLIKKN